MIVPAAYRPPGRVPGGRGCGSDQMTPAELTRENDMNALVPVTFRFPGSLVPKARRVAVIGSFNHWRANSHRLTRIPGGDWIITVFLPPGRVVYGFDVDGTRWLDPHGEDRVSTGSGSEYSARHIGLGLKAPGMRSAPSTRR